MKVTVRCRTCGNDSDERIKIGQSKNIEERRVKIREVLQTIGYCFRDGFGCYKCPKCKET